MSRHRIQAARFAKIVASLDPSRSVLDRFCEAGRLMLDADGAAITMLYDRPMRHTVSSTSVLALKLEEAQELVGEGPGFDAARTDKTVAADFGSTARSTWPALAGCLAELGFAGKILAVPIATSNRRLGVLVAHIFSTSAPFDSAAADYLAHALGPVLLDRMGPESLEAELTEDWSSRAIVHQATGMMVFDLRLSPEDAMALLRAHAYTNDSTLFEMATRVVSGDLRFDNLSMGGE